MTEKAACGYRDSPLDYLAWHADAERRAGEGQEQLYCLLCRRWRWPDELGLNAQPRQERPEGG
jgi:hypothetical protein